VWFALAFCSGWHLLLLLMLCLRRNCTNWEKEFLYITLCFCSLLCADFIYILIRIVFVFALCFKVKCQRRSIGSTAYFFVAIAIAIAFVIVVVVVSQNKSSEKRQRTSTQAHTQTQLIRRSHIHMHICILAAQTFPRAYVHTYVTMYACVDIHTYVAPFLHFVPRRLSV